MCTVVYTQYTHLLHIFMTNTYIQCTRTQYGISVNSLTTAMTPTSRKLQLCNVAYSRCLTCLSFQRKTNTYSQRMMQSKTDKTKPNTSVGPFDIRAKREWTWSLDVWYSHLLSLRTVLSTIRKLNPLTEKAVTIETIAYR